MMDREHRVTIPTVSRLAPADFETVRSSCLSKDELFEDPDFPPSDTALYYSRRPPHEFTWLRPQEIASQYGLKPEFFLNNKVQFDLVQGELGDFWVLAAAALICEQRDTVVKLIPAGQSFNKGWYTGAFHFKFYHHGKWREVVIDDRLPTDRGELVFIHSHAPNEFWGALLEKAYAKLYGSYEALKAGYLSDALHDLSGGLIELYDLTDEQSILPSNLNQVLTKALERRAMIGACINPVPGYHQHVISSGLITHQMYSIQDIRETAVMVGHIEYPVVLVRVKHPQNLPINWAGPWGNKSEDWGNIAPHDRQLLGMISKKPGVFWIELKDLLVNFDSLVICHLPNNVPAAVTPSVNVKQFHGRWQRGVNAGGRPVLRETHWTNPQLRITVDSETDSQGQASCVVELTQKDRRKLKQKSMKHVDMGFVLYKCVKEHPPPLTKDYFDQNNFIARCDYYTNSRNIVKRFYIPPAEYILMPTTYESNVEADFTIRVMLEGSNQSEFLDEMPGSVHPVPVTIDPLLRERESHFRMFFYEVAGEEMEIDVFQFRKVLWIASRTDPTAVQLSLDACKAMVLLVDREGSRRLSYHDFVYLWNCLRNWKNAFQQLDTQGNGFMDAYELRSALAALGFRVTSKVVSKLVFRFANEDYKIDLSNFVQCMVKILILFNMFQSHQQNGRALFTEEQWLEEGLAV